MIHKKPAYRMPKINALWAFLAVDEDGDEGVIGFQAGDGPVPLVGADENRVESYRELATLTALASGLTVRLVKFSTREELEVFTPARGWEKT
jgi:hypothetical protein